MDIPKRLQQIDKQVEGTRQELFVHHCVVTDFLNGDNSGWQKIYYNLATDCAGWDCYREDAIYTSAELVRKLLQEIEDELDYGLTLEEALEPFVDDDINATVRDVCDGLMKALHCVLGYNYFRLHLEYQILCLIPANIMDIDKEKLDNVLDTVDNMYGERMYQVWEQIDDAFLDEFGYRLLGD